MRGFKIPTLVFIACIGSTAHAGIFDIFSRKSSEEAPVEAPSVPNVPSASSDTSSVPSIPTATPSASGSEEAPVKKKVKKKKVKVSNKNIMEAERFPLKTTVFNYGAQYVNGGYYKETNVNSIKSVINDVDFQVLFDGAAFGKDFIGNAENLKKLVSDGNFHIHERVIDFNRDGLNDKLIKLYSLYRQEFYFAGPQKPETPYILLMNDGGVMKVVHQGYADTLHFYAPDAEPYNIFNQQPASVSEVGVFNLIEERPATFKGAVIEDKIAFHNYCLDDVFKPCKFNKSTLTK